MYRMHWDLPFAYLCFLWSNIYLVTVSNSDKGLLSSCVHVFVFCREPVERAGAKASADREDAQFHPHPAGPTYQLVSDDHCQFSCELVVYTVVVLKHEPLLSISLFFQQACSINKFTGSFRCLRQYCLRTPGNSERV